MRNELIDQIASLRILEEVFIKYEESLEVTPIEALTPVEALAYGEALLRISHCMTGLAATMHRVVKRIGRPDHGRLY